MNCSSIEINLKQEYSIYTIPLQHFVLGHLSYNKEAEMVSYHKYVYFYHFLGKNVNSLP